MNALISKLESLRSQRVIHPIYIDGYGIELAKAEGEQHGGEHSERSEHPGLVIEINVDQIDEVISRLKSFELTGDRMRAYVILRPYARLV